MKTLSREKQIEFYNREIQKIITDYKTYLDSKCGDLINKAELYIGSFEYVDTVRNQVIFSFPKDKIPRTKIPLTASKPKTPEILDSSFLQNTYIYYRNNSIISHTECYGIYYQESNGRFNIGFNKIDLDFLNLLKKGDKIVFGISDPPLKYYFNLIQITQNDKKIQRADEVILGNYHLNDFNPTHLEDSLKLLDQYKTDLHHQSTIIIQGPPGTGKTFFISRLLSILSNEGKSVMVATLANRSLIELGKKYISIIDSNKEVVYKSNLTLEESREVKEIKPMPKDFLPANGNILLTTFYKMTGVATEITTDPIYDYVILEEASQCFLGTITAAKLLGKKVILVGDPKQLPPIVNQDNPSNISKDIDLMLQSFTYFASTIKCPKYRFTTTYRFSENACFQTNTFYENSLRSKAKIQKGNAVLNKLPSIYNKAGGSSLYYYDSNNLKRLYNFLYAEISNLLQDNPDFHIAILSSTKKGVKLLRDNLLHQFNDFQDQIIINTVDGVQGLTVDFCFYFAYSDGNPSFSFSINRFNVATSRASFCTLIFLDDTYKIVKPYKGLVANFISKCLVPNEAEIVPNAYENNSGSQEFDVVKMTTGINADNQPHYRENISLPGVNIVGIVDLSKLEKPKKELSPDKENIYIIDTNVFVEYPDIISKIDKKYRIVLSAKVIDELDYLKISLSDEQKKNVQKALRLINENLGKRNIKMDTADPSLLPNDFNKKSPDNLILSVALKYKNENPIMLTSDNGLQIKSKGLQITTITLKEFLKQLKY